MKNIFAMTYKMLALAVILILFSFNSVASGISVHISENGNITSDLTPYDQSVYVSKNNVKKLDPKIPTDAHKLADSIEFEVFTISENSSAHTVFQSGGGVCYAYNAAGVFVIDSATYYKQGSKTEYYANISDGIVTSKGEVKNLQYASVFNIVTPETLQEAKEQDAKYGKVLAEHNLKKRTETHLVNLCDKKRKS